MVIATSSTASILVLMVAITCFIVRRRYKVSRRVIWVENKFHSSDSENENAEITSLIPNWLMMNKHMIFPEESVKKDKLLGKGQYGCVHKGKLFQGNAVWVYYINYCEGKWN